MKCTLATVIAALLAVAAPAAFGIDETASPSASSALTPYQWHQQQLVAFRESERVYQQALQLDGLLAQLESMQQAYRSSRDRAFRIVFGQYLSWYQSFVGDYPAAMATYSIREVAASGDAPSPLTGGYAAKPAVDAIVALARGQKAVFFNEAHNIPLTRTVTLEALAKLRAEGFNTFAAETLYDSDQSLQKRGYPIDGSGFYTEEPICAELVRTALKLGFKVVAYESDQPGNGDVREYAQAKNLYERVFKNDPAARLVVDAGYAHIQERGRYLGGRSMAQHFRDLTHIDPLTIEQTMLIEHPAGGENHPYYRQIIDALKPAQPIVFIGKDGKPWSLKPGAYDASVVFPPDVLEDGRPTWLTIGGLRVPYTVTADLCNKAFPCLVEARYADESDKAIPADRLVLRIAPSGAPLEERIVQGPVTVKSELYLRPGQYTLTARDSGNRLLSRQAVTVAASGTTASPPAAAPASVVATPASPASKEGKPR